MTSGRGVLILGSSSPIGLAIATAFRESGDSVVGIALEPNAGEFFTHSIVADCSDPLRATEAVQIALGHLEHLDIVVLAAAAMPVAAVSDTTDAQWHAAIGATLDAAFFVVRAAVPHLAAGAAIVAVSSVNAFLAAPGVAAYAAAKGGVDALIRQIALDLGPKGIRANIVSPGLIGGDGLENAAAGYPLGRTGTPEDVAGAVLFLSSPAASFISGVTLPVDGGLSIASPAAYLRPDLRARFLPD